MANLNISTIVEISSVLLTATRIVMAISLSTIVEILIVILTNREWDTSYKFTNIITYIKLLQGLQNSKDSDKTSSRSFSNFKFQ